ncbi:hypothetical protein GA0115247_126739, partial [Streptomyces sp. PalvLS-984]
MDASTAAGVEGRHATDRARPPEGAPDASADHRPAGPEDT